MGRRQPKFEKTKKTFLPESSPLSSFFSRISHTHTQKNLLYSDFKNFLKNKNKKFGSPNIKKENKKSVGSV